MWEIFQAKTETPASSEVPTTGFGEVGEAAGVVAATGSVKSKVEEEKAHSKMKAKDSDASDDDLMGWDA